MKILNLASIWNCVRNSYLSGCLIGVGIRESQGESKVLKFYIKLCIIWLHVMSNSTFSGKALILLKCPSPNLRVFNHHFKYQKSSVFYISLYLFFCSFLYIFSFFFCHWLNWPLPETIIWTSRKKRSQQYQNTDEDRKSGFT